MKKDDSRNDGIEGKALDESTTTESVEKEQDDIGDKAKSKQEKEKIELKNKEENKKQKEVRRKR